MDTEDIGVKGVGVVVQSSSGDDEDSGVDEERKGEEGNGELEDGYFEGVLDCSQRGDIVLLFHVVVKFDFGLRGKKAVLSIKIYKSWLNDSRSKVQAVWHDRCPKNSTGLVDAAVDC